MTEDQQDGWPREPGNGEGSEGVQPVRRDRAHLTRARRRIIGFIVVLALADVAYRVLYASGLQRTAALFVGVPALLAIGLVLTEPAKSAVGTLLKGSAIAMLIAGVVLPEGLLCLLIAYPLVGFICVVVGVVVDGARARGLARRSTLMVLGLPLLVLSSEGVVRSPASPHDAASASVVVAAPPEAVAAALVRTPSFVAPRSSFLRMGFNRPVQASGSGITVGDVRIIEFAGGSRDDHPGRLFAGTATAGMASRSNMRLRVSSSGPGRVVFTVDDDRTMLARWATLERAVVTWRRLASGGTRVTWRLEYDRLLNPSFYFGPMERYGLGQAARYLLDSVVVRSIP
ncbi:MAG: hypothetical protein HYX34_15435 [Actinobacteria bacterium]|nr:hypothetical protein [Actinomycetota bacterium]